MNNPLLDIALAFKLIVPEVILLGTMCLHFLVGPFLTGSDGKASTGLRHRFGGLALIAFAAAIYAWLGTTPTAPSMGPFVCDQLTWYTRGVMLAAGVLLTLVNWSSCEDGLMAESQACLLAIVAGVNFVSLANDLTTLFLALELVSIPTYLFLGLPKRTGLCLEASIKYFLLSVFSSAFLLYGLSFFYGATGTTNLTAMKAALLETPSAGAPPLILVGLVMVLAGLSFRIGAVPFHFYAPDVFAGAAPAGAALLSFVPKMAGFVAILRLLPFTSSGEAASEEMMSAVTSLLWWLAIITMFVGNCMASVQTDVRRMLAYSSIAHAGYMLVGLAIGNQSTAHLNGVEALLFYLPVYGLMTLGTFAVLSAVTNPKGEPVRNLDDLAGLSQRHPGLSLMLLLFVLSLMGLPPTAGFLGKLNLFWAAWSSGWEGAELLAILLTINAMIAAGYYLRILVAAYFGPAETSATEPRPVLAVGPVIASAVCCVATIAIFFSPSWIWRLIAFS